MRLDKQTSNLEQQEIINAIGGFPRTTLGYNKKSYPLRLIIIAITLCTIVFALIVASASVTNKTNTAETYSLDPVDSDLSVAKQAESKVTAYIDLLRGSDYSASSSNFIARDTALYELASNHQGLEVYTGKDVDWRSCSLLQTDRFRQAIWRINSLEYEVVYVRVECSAGQNEMRELEFDVRKISASDYKIFDIIARVL